MKEKRLGFIRGFSEAQLMTQGNVDLTIVSQVLATGQQRGIKSYGRYSGSKTLILIYW